MSLQSLYALLVAQPGQGLNVLALFFALAGAWLLLATRQRQLRLGTQLAAEQGMEDDDGLDEATARMNRFFFLFGFACLSLALLLSWSSTRL